MICTINTRNCQVCDTKSTTLCSWSISHDVICDTRYDKKKTVWYYAGTCTWYVRSKLFKHGPAMPLNTRCRAWLDQLKTTYSKTQQEKASLVCVRVQSPSGLALVPCALSMVDLSGQLRCWMTHTQTWYRKMFCFLFLAPYARTTRYEKAFFPLENQGKKGSLRSRASWLQIVWCLRYHSWRKCKDSCRINLHTDAR